MDEILRKLALLRSLDQELSVFGSLEHRYLLNPPLSADAARSFEDRHGIKLPNEYRDFLIHLGNGGAGPAYGLLPLEYANPHAQFSHLALRPWRAEPFTSLGRPFPYSGDWSIDEATYEQLSEGPDEDAYMSGALIVCYEGCGYLYILPVNGNHQGTIWFDATVSDGPIKPMGITFLQWYMQWLDEKISGLGHK